MSALPAAEARRMATDGEIAVINLESSRHGAWRRFLAEPRREGLAEAIVEQEMLVLQFLGDLDALDRMARAAQELARVDPSSSRTALVEAQVASAQHRFADARRHLEQARLRGASGDEVDRLVLSVHQACATQLDMVLDARRRNAARSGRLEELVPLGALLADMQQFDEADAVYRHALDAYDDVSPFPLAWTCFQLGTLWGELAADCDADLAAAWYGRAIEYLPSYVRARVHLAEIRADDARLADAEALLQPVLASGDPEVAWRLADILALLERREEAVARLRAARSRFEELLARHELAFADHAAEFYAGSGGDRRRALELARINAANRPTRRALAQAQAMEALAC